jgi:hypothetical protein
MRIGPVAERHEDRRRARGERLTNRVVFEATSSASTTEDEYIAITEAGREIMGLRELLETLGHPQLITTLRCDNQGAISLTQQPSSHPRTKHIAIRHHQIREWTEQGMIRLEYIDTKSQKADILTKS